MTDKYDELAVVIRQLLALLNDRHTDLKSWNWLVEHNCHTAVDLMCDLNLLTEHTEE